MTPDQWGLWSPLEGYRTCPGPTPRSSPTTSWPWPVAATAPIGQIAGVGLAAAGTAPLTAGLMVGAWDWHAVFLVSGMLAVLVMLLVLTLHDARATQGRWAEIDVVGAPTVVAAR